jgi:hypothetical protein
LTSLGSKNQECGKMKIKTIRLECQVCSKMASTQLFYNSAGKLTYARCRHYTGQLNGKPQFEYHQQSLEYVMSKMNNIEKCTSDQTTNDHTDQNIQATGQKSDLANCNNLKSTFSYGDTRNVLGGCRLVWFRTLAFQANDPGFKSRRPHHYYL